MDMETLKAFFLWSTLINAAILILALLLCAIAGEWIYRKHSSWIPISKEVFYAAIYGFIGIYKLFILVFNLTPYLALLIVG